MATQRFLVSVVVFVVCATSCSSIKLPSYIKGCRRDDPEINACVLKSGNAALQQIIKLGGDRKYNIPSITPLFVTQLNIRENGLNLTFNNMNLKGLENMILSAANVDFNKRREEFELIIPRLEIIADYVIAGRILVLPIQGSGAANITVPNLKVLVSHDYDLKRGKTGKEHMATKNPSLVIIGKPAGYIQLDNLFGNEELSLNMNLVLNQNSEDVIAEVGPAVAEAMGVVGDQIFNGITRLVPFDEMYFLT